MKVLYPIDSIEDKTGNFKEGSGLHTRVRVHGADHKKYLFSLPQFLGKIGRQSLLHDSRSGFFDIILNSQEFRLHRFSVDFD
jgi:hypothetical protein